MMQFIGQDTLWRFVWTFKGRDDSYYHLYFSPLNFTWRVENIYGERISS